MFWKRIAEFIEKVISFLIFSLVISLLIALSREEVGDYPDRKELHDHFDENPKYPESDLFEEGMG